MNHVQGKVIAITGAGGGFGRLVACKTAALGAAVVAIDIDEQALAATADLVGQGGGQVCSVVADVTRAEDMTGMVDTAVERLGGIDVLVNNAGTMPLAFYADHARALDAWHRCIDINFKGVLNGIVAVHDHMIARGRGHIVNLSSIYGNYPVKGAAVYGATKAAVNVLSESLRQESQGRIKVTTIRPTGVPTTGLVGSIVNFEAGAGITGTNAAAFGERFGAIMEGRAPPAWTDRESIEYFSLDANDIAEQIVFAINQPWGVSISDLTVRASGDLYVI